MSVKQTQLFGPPVRDSGLSAGLQRFLFTLQMLLPLVVIDTTAGAIVESVPPAGLNSPNTGESNQNMEITYKKISADANPFTLNGVADGAIVISAQWSFFKIKSDGTNWYRTG